MEPIKIPFDISILSPFHIGTGDEVDPLSMVFRNDRAYRLQQLEYIRYLLQAHKAELERVMASQDIKAMHRFFHQHFDPEMKNTWSFSYPVTTQVAADYVTKMNEASNQGLIKAFIRSQVSLQPFIPGSSIKGSVRTAILSSLNGNGRDWNSFDKHADQNHQARLLKYFKNDTGKADITLDPFKFIKFADIPFSNDWISVRKVEVINPPAEKPRDPGLRHQLQGGRPLKEEAIPVYMELGLSAKETRTLSSELSILITDNNNQGIMSILPKGKDSLPEFIKMIKDYYQGQFAKEENIYNRFLNGKAVYDVLKAHFQAIEAKKNECMIRIGYGSGQNYCTYASMNYAPKSRKMVSHLPLGWFKLSFRLS